MPKRLSKAELFYLAENPQGLTAKELAKELGFHENVIKKYIKSKVEKIVETHFQIPPEVKVEIKPKSIPNDENADNKMAKRIKNGQVMATIMTPGASEVGDVVRDKRGGSRLGSSMQSAIHQPKGPNFNPKMENPYEKIKELQNEIDRLKNNG